MPKGTPAQKLAKAKHWINTYRDRIAKIELEGDKRAKRKNAIRISEMKYKIKLWQTQMCRWEKERDDTKPIRSIIKYAETYFGTENFKFGVYDNKKRTNLILFAKYMMESGYATALTSQLLGVTLSALSKKRKMYDAKTMSTAYQSFKKHINDRLSKKRETRNSRKSEVTGRAILSDNPNSEPLQSLREEVL
jgi:hypothetical protein